MDGREAPVVTVTSPRHRSSPARAVVIAIVSLFVFAEPMASRPAASTLSMADTGIATSTASIADSELSIVTRSFTTVSTPVRTMRSLINATRNSFNRVGLRLNSRLNLVAQRHSARMAKLNRLHHNPNLVKDVGDMPWKVLGENVGVGNTVQTLHTAFMNSPSHRSNILRSSYRQVGIGVLFSKGRTWVTVVFYA
jgi:uncharacterized protein YkwD